MNFMNFKALRIKFKIFKTTINLKKFERHNYAVMLLDLENIVKIMY